MDDKFFSPGRGFDSKEPELDGKETVKNIKFSGAEKKKQIPHRHLPNQKWKKSAPPAELKSTFGKKPHRKDTSPKLEATPGSPSVDPLKQKLEELANKLSGE